MVYDVTNQQLTAFDRWRTNRPHVVILGAGASFAAFPSGDARGKRLPLMANVVDVLGLKRLVKEAGFDPKGNFERLYSRLHSLEPQPPILAHIEQRVTDYFGSLELPNYPTLYDLILLSMREKDAIFTFNWDPFLADAYIRNSGEAPLPNIFHLHGNVRVAFCGTCGHSLPKAEVCDQCGKTLVPSRLLFPVEKKNYGDDRFISSQWDAARDYIKCAALITIFGYSAPKTDTEAMAILNEAWKVDDPEKKPVERVEIIDIRDHEELSRLWFPFAHFDHYDIRRSFYESWLAHFPRRTCEALAHGGIDGHFVEPIPWAGSLEGIRNTLSDLIAAEG